jgi:exonuclease VII small subunit
MVLVAFLSGLAVVVVATVVCVVRGVRLWRQLKRTSRTIGAELNTFEARTARTETLLAQVERKSGELEAALERLRISRARLQVLRDALESAQGRLRWLRALLPV